MSRIDGGPVGEGFDALFLAEWPRVVGIARRVLGSGVAAEDAAQEVFLAFYRRFGNALPERPGPWLYAAATHTALNVLRGERRRERREQLEGQKAQALLDPAGAVVAREAERELQCALRRMRPMNAAILALRYAGLRYQEIAQTLQIPVDQVGTRLRRAEIALRKEIGNASSERR
ncbi:MAG: sigma-70 family RNA polymerase sigma factor [Thermaerobacter sp.]|nr:sigma-70 family RNA polymerase sigma factor [Thermaerobacter sp.]